MCTWTRPQRDAVGSGVGGSLDNVEARRDAADQHAVIKVGKGAIYGDSEREAVGRLVGALLLEAGGKGGQGGGRAGRRVGEMIQNRHGSGGGRAEH